MPNQTEFQKTNKHVIPQSRRRGRRKAVSFNPGHGYIDSAVEDFLRGGGTITKVEANQENYQAFLLMKDKMPAANDFLMGN